MRTTQQRSNVIGWLIVGLLVTQLACRTVMGGAVPVATGAPAPDATPAQSPIPPTELETEHGAQPGKSPALTPPYLPTTAPGVACVGTFGFGVTCLENGEWLTYSKSEGDFASDQIQAMTICPDGDVLVAHSLGLGRYGDHEWRSYEKGWGVSSAEAVACGAGSTLWVAHFQGVSHFDGARWRTYSALEHLVGEPDAVELLNDIAITAGGDVWAVTANSIAWFTGEEWTVFAEGAGFAERYFFANIALDAQGRPWVSASRGVFVFDGLTWTAFPNDDFLTPTALAVDAQGRVWVGTLSRGLYVLHPDGSWSNYTRANSRLNSNHVSTLIVDGQGRLWIGTVWGLNVLMADVWYSYRMDNAGLADQDITTLAVVDGGPPLPKPRSKAPGSLSGQIMDADGAALANAPLELCVEKLYRDEYDSSPCGDQPFFRSTTTDAEGRFSFNALPMGRYVFAVNVNGVWRRITDERGFGSLQVLVTTGENTDLGTVALVDED